MSLWSTPIDPKDAKDSPFKDLTIDDSITAEELAASLKKKQDDCKHNLTRFGPSYTARQDGSYRKFDESICLKCGYDGKEYK